jgi:hypothetical protein
MKPVHHLTPASALTLTPGIAVGDLACVAHGVAGRVPLKESENHHHARSKTEDSGGVHESAVVEIGKALVSLNKTSGSIHFNGDRFLGPPL